LEGKAQHYRVIESLASTMGVDAKRIARLQSYRKKRNISNYERARWCLSARGQGNGYLGRRATR
jgi:hypothetical protein